MTQAKHTPGPWHVETVTASCGICHKVGPFPGKRPDDKPRHACLYADYPSKGNPADDELEANARLIAASPELLEFAEEVRRSGDTRLASMAIAIINKATGGAA